MGRPDEPLPERVRWRPAASGGRSRGERHGHHHGQALAAGGAGHCGANPPVRGVVSQAQPVVAGAGEGAAERRAQRASPRVAARGCSDLQAGGQRPAGRVCDGPGAGGERRARRQQLHRGGGAAAGALLRAGVPLCHRYDGGSQGSRGGGGAAERLRRRAPAGGRHAGGHPRVQLMLESARGGGGAAAQRPTCLAAGGRPRQRAERKLTLALLRPRMRPHARKYHRRSRRARRPDMSPPRRAGMARGPKTHHSSLPQMRTASSRYNRELYSHLREESRQAV
mmetsp:Transcript_14883/g.38594  ORF Transcript_14883/g.38594 Transcript_14883/m.38594 type:complete len:281 (+) Transcript_14883:528-1370(+)